MEDESRSRVTQAHNRKAARVKVDDETTIIVEARILPGSDEADVSNRLQQFDQVTKSIEKVSAALTRAWEKSGPSRASVEFHLEFAWSAGNLLAMFVEGSTAASMKITLEWEKP